MNRDVTTRVLFVILLIVVLVFTYRAVAPFLTGFIWAAVLVAAFRPLHDRLVRVLGGKEGAASAVVTLLVAAFVVVPLLAAAVAAVQGGSAGIHYVLATGGYLRQVMRLPDFLGGPVFLGGWLDNGAAFDEWRDVNWATQASLGVIADTLLGPAFAATSAGFDGRWRFYIGLGHVF